MAVGGIGDWCSANYDGDGRDLDPPPMMAVHCCEKEKEF